MSPGLKMATYLSLPPEVRTISTHTHTPHCLASFHIGIDVKRADCLSVRFFLQVVDFYVEEYAELFHADRLNSLTLQVGRQAGRQAGATTRHTHVLIRANWDPGLAT